MADNYMKFLKGLSKDELEAEIEDKISKCEQDLLDAEAVASEIARSNATGWGLDTHAEILDIKFSQDQARVRVSFVLSGNQDDDKPFSGTEINGEATGVVDDSGQVRFVGVTAERSLDDEPDDDEA